ncbi:Gfo/Idh/MocA family protein [Roseiflexus sp.]|uniref:Gfo/Idh/MocA family protein n=1 Tax=Roseiflexus sp. TaxID=2562120 RepID=UPI00398AF7F7
MAQSSVRWGILSTGRIAGVFAEALHSLDDAQLVAVGSRSADAAAAFGDRFNVPRRYASYEELAADPDVDIIYIATPHALHAENCLLCLHHGKAVLCEKPFTINARQAADVIAIARERGLFLMEAMWTRFLPAIVRLRELLAAGAIGEVRMIASDFGFRTDVNPRSRLFDPALGGGSLLDVGVYTVSLASMVFGGEPERIATMAHLGATGVDEEAAMILGYDGGRMAVLWSAIRTETPHEATIMGTEGMIRVHPQWWRAKTITLSCGGRADEVIDLPYQGNGYQFEAIEAMRCLRAGLNESSVMPLDETLGIMRTLDAIRAQWGLTYPIE